MNPYQITISFYRITIKSDMGPYQIERRGGDSTNYDEQSSPKICYTRVRFCLCLFLHRRHCLFTPSADMHLQSKEQVSRTNRTFRSCTGRRYEIARVLLDDCCWRHPCRLWIVLNSHRGRYAIHELGFVSSCCCAVMVFFISSTNVHQQLGEQVSITHRPRIQY